MTCSSIPPVGVAAQPTCSCGSWLALPERTAGHWSAGSRRTTTIAAAASTTSTPRAPCGSPTTCRPPPPRPHRACVLLIVAKPGNGGGDDQDDVGWCMPKAPRSNGSASSPSQREWAAQGELLGRPHNELMAAAVESGEGWAEGPSRRDARAPFRRPRQRAPCSWGGTAQRKGAHADARHGRQAG